MQPQLSNLKEIRPHGTKAFPCAIYQTRSGGKGVLVKHHISVNSDTCIGFIFLSPLLILRNPVYP